MVCSDCAAIEGEPDGETRVDAAGRSGVRPLGRSKPTFEFCDTCTFLPEREEGVSEAVGLTVGDAEVSYK